MKKTRNKKRTADIPPGATQASLPLRLSPQLATLASMVPALGEWLYEIKFDGYRIMTRVEGGQPALITRRGHDWSSKMPQLLQELKTVGLHSGWLDGEIVVMREDGIPDFNALQDALDHSPASGITYFLFDVPFYEGYDLRKVPLQTRRSFLQTLLTQSTTQHVRFSDAFDGDPREILASACRMNLEGIIAKRASAAYVSSRTEDWLKLKCKKRQEFVIVGYHDRAAAGGQVGSLILGVYENGTLVPVGSVGTGWSAETAAALKTKLASIEQADPPFAGGPKKPGRWSKRKPGGERWVQPVLVAEVEFSDWTSEGQVRHASFISLRNDKAPTSVRRERTADADR
jgi:bifunctional non-homologous end joining protein LigD